MFSSFMPTRRLSAKKQTKPASYVKTFTQDWEKDVRDQLAVTKTALMCCSQEERAFYKEKAKMLNDVLHLLQGKTPVKKNNLREESESLKMQLQQVTSDYEKTSTNYTLHKTLNTDLKIQLNRQFKSTNDAVKENKVLRRKVQSMKDMYSQRLKNSLPVKDVKRKKTGVPSLQRAAYQTLAATLSDQRQMIKKLRDNLSEAERKLSVSRHEIESIKDWYSHRLEGSAPVKDAAMKTVRVPSLQLAARNTLATTLSNQRQMMNEFRDNLSEAQRKLNISCHKFQNMKDLYSQRLENCHPVKYFLAKTTRVQSLQRAAYQTLATTLDDQRKMIAKLRGDLREAERNLQQARESFLIKEHELQKKVQTMMEKLESQNAVYARRPNAVILGFARLYRCLCDSPTVGTMWIWMLTMLSIFFWRNSR